MSKDTSKDTSKGKTSRAKAKELLLELRALRRKAPVMARAFEEKHPGAWQLRNAKNYLRYVEKCLSYYVYPRWYLWKFLANDLSNPASHQAALGVLALKAKELGLPAGPKRPDLKLISLVVLALPKDEPLREFKETVTKAWRVAVGLEVVAT